MDSEYDGKGSPSLVSSRRSQPVSRMKSVSWISKTMTQKSIDESESMLEHIRDRRSRRRDTSSQDESLQQAAESSDPEEIPTFRRAESPDEAGPSTGRPSEPDEGGGGDSPRAPAVAPRRLSTVGQEHFRSVLQKRLSKAEIKGHGRAQRKGRAHPPTRFDALREGGTNRPYDAYLASRAASQAGPSTIQAYDFFCRVWDDPVQAAQRPATPPSAPPDEESGESRPLVELLGGEMESLTLHVPAQTLSRKTQLEREAELYFTPSLVPAAVEERLPPGVRLRDLAEDGIYVAHRALQPSRNLHKLENRLLRHSGRSWFGEDGQLICLPDPLLNRPCHHDYKDVSDDVLTDYLPATVDQLQQEPEPRGEHDLRLQLHVHVLSVRLAEHALFSREQRAAAALAELHAEHTRMVDEGTVERLTQRLWAVRRARDGVLAARQQQAEPDDQSEQIQRRRIDDYVSSIQRLRAQRDTAAGQQRRLCRSILRRWRELKGLREDQGFSSTPLRLVVQDLAVDAEQEAELWQRELQAELDELEAEHRQHRDQLMESYRRELAEWKQRRRELGSGADEQQQLGPRPQPPAEFDRQKTLAEIKTRATGNRRPPGEPKLAFDLLDTHPVTALNECPKSEQQRRQAVSRCQLSVRAFLGGREVSRTRPQPLSQDMTAAFEQLFAVRLRHAPDAVHLWVCEEGSLSSHVIAKVRLPAPASHVTSRTVRPEWVPFSSAAGGGGGGGGGGGAEPTRGQLQAAVCWGLDEETGAVLAPPGDAVVGPTSDPALEPGPDPNDPAELSLTSHDLPESVLAGQPVAEAAGPGSVGRDCFLAGAPDPDASLRCRLLRLRHAGVQEFRHVTMVPLREQQVPQQPFTAYKKRLEAQSGDGEADGAAEPARRSVLQYQLRIKEMVAQRFRAARKHKRLSDVVREDQVPDIGTIGSVFGSLFSARRPLNPPRRQKKPHPFVDIQGQDLRLICHVVRAFNVPVRRDQDTVRSDFSRPVVSGPATVAQSSLLPEVTVRPFMELTFQRNTVRSNVAEGANPTWNQDLKLPVIMQPHESAGVQCLDDVIYLSLQDEVLVDLLEDDRQVDTNIHQRIERRWLADLRIPFSTLYINGRVVGTFRLNTPPLLIGYECDVTARAAAFQLTESLPTGHSGTYVSIFMTLEPPLNIPPMVQERLDSMETEKLLSHCEAWTREYQQQYPGRRLRCTVLDVTGRSALVCRYIRPLRPPDALLAGSSNEEDQARLVARFVSLIPNISDVNFFSGMYDLWTTCQEFLDMQAGDEEEHAILLCNFFLYLGKRAYLVLGSGIPEGYTAYVLTDEATDRWLWNPCTGERRSASESYSHLLTVGCLISAENVWANTQVYGQPASMSFDVNLVRDWRPLFTARHPAPAELASVQAAALRYTATDAGRVQTEAERLERRLRDHVQTWRQRSNWTPWNRSCSDALRRMLPLLERSTFTPAISPAQLADEQTRLLANIHAAYKVCGVPLNMPHRSEEAVVESLFALGVHKNDSRDAEFALAVHMEPYPSDVVSVWVYVAALTRRR